MKTLTVTTTVEKQIEFPWAVPCVFKYSEMQENPADFEKGEFWSCLLVKVDENYNVSSIKIAKQSFFSEGHVEYDFSAKSCYTVADILKYKMIEVTPDWWDAAKKVVFDYWRDK
jgi:hypothetical protein